MKLLNVLQVLAAPCLLLGPPLCGCQALGSRGFVACC